MSKAKIELRDISIDDVPLAADYWYNSPPGFIESIGIDPKLLPPEGDFVSFMTSRIEQNLAQEQSKMWVLTILCDGQAVGYHPLHPIEENDYGVFHAHIWNTDKRGQGIASQTYPLACKTFVDRFNLQKIVFRTPVQNKAAIRVKEKLGIPCLGEETLDLAMVKEGTKAIRFEWDKEEIERFRPTVERQI